MHDAASVGGSSSQLSGSEIQDAASSIVDAGHGLGPNPILCRRAKRLKKLKKMMTCTSAQSAALRFRSHTLVIIAIMLVAHLVGYIIVSTQISSRFT